VSRERPDIEAPSYYVGIGASAGGLEALGTFFTNVKAAGGLAFIVMQHLSPEYKGSRRDRDGSGSGFLQSYPGEVTLLYKELQSTNEELHTVNAEHRKPES
jgi:hypothetical protein